MYKFYARTTKRFLILDGYKLNKRFAASKNLLDAHVSATAGDSKAAWEITDLATGMLVKKNLATIQECRKWISNEENVAGIEKRIADRVDYKECVEALSTYIKENGKAEDKDEQA